MTHYRNSSWIVAIICVGVSCLHAQSQMELNEQACGESHKADIAMEQTFSDVLTEYSKDQQFIARLKAAQKAWLAFREAEVEALFPKSDKQAEYGTVYPMCHCSQLQHLTEERTKQLKLWLDGIPEGDVCSGSVKHSQRIRCSPEITAMAKRKD